jgi:flagellar assembly protein FliH
LLKLCVESVEKIVRHEIRTDPKVVLRVIKACLRRVTESDEVRVRVNPSELAAVRAQRDELLQIAEGVRAINIMDDRRVSPGGCTVETATGDFDATVETQMEKIERKLVETFKNECSETGIESGEISQGDRPY